MSLALASHWNLRNELDDSYSLQRKQTLFILDWKITFSVISPLFLIDINVQHINTNELKLKC